MALVPLFNFNKGCVWVESKDVCILIYNCFNVVQSKTQHSVQYTKTSNNDLWLNAIIIALSR